MTDRFDDHDPREFVRGIHRILISDTKRIGFLCGAGTSIAINDGASKESQVPGVLQMTKAIVESITEKKFGCALKQVESELKEQNVPFQIEEILSSIVLKERVVGKEKLCGLSKVDLASLRQLLEQKIIGLVSVHKKSSLFLRKLVHCDFALWVAQAQRKRPIEIFTTNYDYLFELGLEYHQVPYFDGFVGGYEPFFCSPIVEDTSFYPKHTKLWKLHGSLGWQFAEAQSRIIRRTRDDSTIIIYPSLQKYEESKKQPYLSFMDRLAAFLREDDGVLFVSGYSFSDQHINDVLLRALSINGTSHVIALYYDEIANGDAREYLLSANCPATALAERNSQLSIYGMRSAVIGGRFGKWRLKNEPSKDDSIMIDTYFDEDAAIPSENDTDANTWTGEGKLILPDFAKFTRFLAGLRRRSLEESA